MSIFHTSDNVFFRRLDNGDVEVSQRMRREGCTDDPDTWFKGFVHVVPASIWASVVASVSSKGEDGGRFYQAQAFHDGAALP